MAGCPALDCTFLDQFENPFPSVQDSGYLQSPPAILADSDIAGLGVCALSFSICKSLILLSGHSRVLIICLCHLGRGCHWLQLRIRR